MSLSLSIYHTSSYQWNKLMPSSHISTAAVINSRCRFRWGPVFWRLSWPAWIGHPVHLHICPRQMWRLNFLSDQTWRGKFDPKNGYAKYTILLILLILYCITYIDETGNDWHHDIQIYSCQNPVQAVKLRSSFDELSFCTSLRQLFAWASKRVSSLNTIFSHKNSALWNSAKVIPLNF